MSLAMRIAFRSALFGLVLVALGGALAYHILQRELSESSSRELAHKHLLLLHALEELPAGSTITSNRERFNDLLTGHDLAATLIDPTTRAVLETISPNGRANDVRDLPVSLSDAPVTWPSQTEPNISYIGNLTKLQSGQSLGVVLSINRDTDVEILRDFSKAAFLGLPILLIVVALGAWAIARTSLVPLARFTRLASSVGSRTLARRLRLDGLPTELLELAEDFNAMLARIDDGVTRLSQFSADLAHELQTPVGILIGRSQVALSKHRTAEELSDVLASNIEELERLSRLISEMLFLASADHGDAGVRLETVDLAEEAQRVADFLELNAEERALNISVSGRASVAADRVLVQRAVTNLVSNAVRHATPETEIAIVISAQGVDRQVSVTNVGAPIPVEHQQRLFDRFYRVDEGRARTEGGTGLGLAIVQSIAAAHRGRVTIESTPEGRTTFSLLLPASDVIEPTASR